MASVLNLGELAVLFVQLRLGVEGVYLRDPAIHIEKDDAASLRRKVRNARRQRRQRRISSQNVALHQVPQRQHAEAHGAAFQEITAID